MHKYLATHDTAFKHLYASENISINFKITFLALSDIPQIHSSYASSG
ncbi:hypothetical protein HMPREF6745_2238 [Prevotella sp. oral taxon 472 str. F0295]|nr:hypothetical protein HMPREF6745_2238 [Prevotella sp. oral taxon 472 str. F0295]